MQQKTQSRDIAVAVQLGNLAVSINAEGVSWNPTIARDMQDRAISMLAETLAMAMANGVAVTTHEVIFDDGSAETEDEDEDENG